ncbi:MAG: NAD(P)-dependent oxidoreductase [Acidimicrobiales bacterium]|nr:NAD(P)-dependent oxidoreductase [Acidimicrobiales bacterium]
MRDCLVTGGAGFIGRPLVASLRASGRFRSVVVLDIEAGDETDVVADVTMPLDALAFTDYDFSHCVHLAGVAREPGFDHFTYYDVNDRGTANVLDLCTELGVQHVVFTSTMMVFAAGEDRHGEADSVCPDTAYGGSKALAEARVLRWGDHPGRTVRVVRPGVVFGPGDEGNFERMRRLLGRKLFFYVGRTDTVKSCIHLDDAVGLLHHLTIEAPGTEPGEPIVHCAFPDPVTLEDIVRGMFAAFGGDYRVPVVPFRLAHAGSRPFVLLARVGLDTGVHPRRIEKLYRSTNISADAMLRSGYQLIYPTVATALKAWAEAEPNR